MRSIGRKDEKIHHISGFCAVTHILRQIRNAKDGKAAIMDCCFKKQIDSGDSLKENLFAYEFDCGILGLARCLKREIRKLLIEILRERDKWCGKSERS
jgi:hypothetical protein